MKTRGFKSLRRKIKTIERRVETDTKVAAFNAMEQTTTDAQRQLITGRNVWRGELLSSLETHMSPNADGWSFTTRANAPHAKVVEFGSGKRFGVDPYPVSDNVTPLKAPNYSGSLVAAIWNWVQTKQPFYGEPTYAVAASIARTVGSGEFGGVYGKGLGTNSHPYLRPAYFTNWYPVGQSAGVRKIKRAYRNAVRV